MVDKGESGMVMVSIVDNEDEVKGMRKKRQRK